MAVTGRVKRTTKQKVPSIKGPPSLVKVGFPASMTGRDILERAIYNHFGTSRGIPARPFMTAAIAENKDEYEWRMELAAKAILNGRMTVEEALNKLGIQAQRDIQQYITALQTPPNAPSTIRQKGSSNPLIDTGQMRRSVTYVVV